MIVRLLLGIYRKARKPSLYLCVEGVKTLARRMKWRIAFRYIPRQLNSVPDDMCRRAEAAGVLVEYVGGEVPSDAPEVDLAALYRVVDGLAAGARHISYVGPPGAPAGDPIGGADVEDDDGGPAPDDAAVILAAWDDRLRGVPCGVCAGVDREEAMLVCDRCGDPFHAECQPFSPAGDGPWYCS
jgi:hypothetical protein